MTGRKDFEAMLEALINEDQKTARDIFHNIVVSKSRQIYETLLAEDFSAHRGSRLTESVDSDEVQNLVDQLKSGEIDYEQFRQELDTLEYTDQSMRQGEDGFPDRRDDNAWAREKDDYDQLGSENDWEAPDRDLYEASDDYPESDTGDTDTDVDDTELDDTDVDADGELEDRVVDLEDALEELKAEFEELMASGEEELDNDEFDSDSELDDNEFDSETEFGNDEFGADTSGDLATPAPKNNMNTGSASKPVYEYVNKVSLPKAENKSSRSPVASPNRMGGTSANIARGGTSTTGGTSGGLAKPSAKEENFGNMNKPGANVGKTAFKRRVSAPANAKTTDRGAASPISGSRGRSK